MNMADKHNVFISHYGEDEAHLDRLRKRLKNMGCEVRNSSIEKKHYRKDKVSDATIAKELRSHITWAKTFIVLIGEQYPREAMGQLRNTQCRKARKGNCRHLHAWVQRQCRTT